MMGKRVPKSPRLPEIYTNVSSLPKLYLLHELYLVQRQMLLEAMQRFFDILHVCGIFK